MADHAHAAGLERGARLPRRQQILDDGEQLLLGRVPRLQQVVVERDLVDRLDRRLGVGVRRQQDALGLRHELARLDQVIGPGQPRHALVGDQQRHLLAPCANLPQQVKPFGARAGAHHAVALAETASQVSRDSGEHGRLVVDRNDRGTASLLLTVALLRLDPRCFEHRTMLYGGLGRGRASRHRGNAQPSLYFERGVMAAAISAVAAERAGAAMAGSRSILAASPAPS